MNAKKIYNLELEETFEEVNLIALHSSIECYQLAFYFFLVKIKTREF